MDSTGYVALTRQSGLSREMDLIAQNLANLSTAGFRREGVVFAEFVRAGENGSASLSMAHANARAIDLSQSTVEQTGGTFDFAIQGEGFFLVETAGGNQLTRAGSFTPGPTGELVTPEGNRLLDEGGAPVFVPPDARTVALAGDGTLSADGVPVAKLGLWEPVDLLTLKRESDTRFSAAELQPAESPGSILQGYLEDSNVEPVIEIARMIEVQRAYELGQSFLDREDDRIANVIQTLGR